MLKTIHENYDYVQIKSGVILQLHRDLYRFMESGSGGYFKTADNVIAEVDSEGNKKMRFQPVEARGIPDAIESRCKAFDETLMSDNHTKSFNRASGTEKDN